MPRKYADISVHLTVGFDDNGVDALEEQALAAAEEALGLTAFAFVPEVMTVELVGDIRETELPEQPEAAAGEGA